MSASTPTAAAEAATKYTIYDIINSFRQIKKIFQSTISTNIDNYQKHLHNYSFQRFIKTFNTVISAQKEKNHFYYKIISQSNQRICDSISNKIVTAREKIISQVNEYDSRLAMSQQKIHHQQKNLRYAQQQIMNQFQQQLVQLKIKLNELQPVNTIYNQQQQKINSVTHVKINQEVYHYLKDGILQSKITNISTHKNN